MQKKMSGKTVLYFKKRKHFWHLICLSSSIWFAELSCGAQAQSSCQGWSQAGCGEQAASSAFLDL